ncbi:MAG: hypothetical protein LJE93_02670 [Acidobacteria bacterium]|nr:hypothetical protein [Acidobacteriota bacterium]
MSAPVSLVVSSDDFLLEQSLAETLKSMCADFGGVDPDMQPETISPEDLAVELCSPSLFAQQRVLVVPDVRSWLDIPARRPPLARKAVKATVDPMPVVRVLNDGLPEGVGLVMGAWCHGRPKCALVDAVGEIGEVQWRPAPEPPKPWEDTILSREQETMLRKLVTAHAGDVRFSPEALRLLLDRLGFAPRALVQECRKLVAANVDGVVDEDLVRALSFPRERSLDVVRDGVLARQSAPVLDIMAAAEAGIQIRDRQGKPVAPKGVPAVLFSQISALLQNLLYLRRLAADNGLLDEMAPDRTREHTWYPRRFKSGLGPTIIELAKTDAPSPLWGATGKGPSPFTLGALFRGAGRYSDDELVQALADAGAVELALRGDMPGETLSVWLTSFLH